jgi:hypothetical protein
MDFEVVVFMNGYWEHAEGEIFGDLYGRHFYHSMGHSLICVGDII